MSSDRTRQVRSLALILCQVKDDRADDPALVHDGGEGFMHFFGWMGQIDDRNAGTN